MKKFVSSLVLCFAFLLCGLVVSGCAGKEEFDITVDVDASLVQLKLIADKQEIRPDEDNHFSVKNSANVRIKLFPATYAVDFSTCTILVNGARRQLIENEAYDPLRQQANQEAGYFLIPRLSADTTILVEGAKQMSSTFTFLAENLEDEDVAFKLSQTQVKLDANSDQFVNLHDFLLSGNPSYVRVLDSAVGTQNTHHTLELKFDNNKFFNLETSKPFKLRLSDGTERNFAATEIFDDHFLLDMGDIGHDEQYTILVDFSQLACNQFDFSLPQETLAYSVSAPKTITCVENGQITIDAKENVVDLSHAEVLLDGVALTQTSASETQAVFEIPKGIAPKNGNTFVVEVKSVLLSANVGTLTTDIPSDFSAKIGTFKNNEVTPFAFTDDNVAVALLGSDVACQWEVKTTQDGLFVNAFDVFDFDVCLNNQKLFNLKECIQQKTAEMTTLQSFEVALENGVSLFATLDEKTQQFTKFRLQFVCGQENVVTFENLKKAEKQLKIDFNFDLSSPFSVQYAISDTLTLNQQWKNFGLDDQTETVTGGQIVSFKIETDVPEDFVSSKLSNPSLCTDFLEITIFEDSIVLQFEISCVQWADCPTLVLENILEV